MSDRLLTAPEVAELLAVPESWVREHTRSGAIPHLRLGRYRRYRESAVIDWLDTLEESSPRFRRYHPTTSYGPRGAQTPGGPTPKG
jgi:excisionase family DNA binding protein